MTCELSVRLPAWFDGAVATLSGSACLFVCWLAFCLAVQSAVSAGKCKALVSDISTASASCRHRLSWKAWTARVHATCVECTCLIVVTFYLPSET